MLKQEEERFAETLEQGMGILEDAISGMTGDEIPGETAFKLYDTYGFPLDLTADIARERGLGIDQAGFDRAMAANVNAAGPAVSSGSASLQAGMAKIIGRRASNDRQPNSSVMTVCRRTATVTLLVKDGAAVEARRPKGDQVVVFLDRTPFYAESGGQVGDTGVLSASGVEICIEDTQKAGKGHAHIGRVVNGKLALGDHLQASVDAGRRRAIVQNHSATHLLHAALRAVLGEHVSQKGSLVAPDRLRFDFSHFEPVTAEQLAQIEDWSTTRSRPTPRPRRRRWHSMMRSPPARWRCLARNTTTRCAC